MNRKAQLTLGQVIEYLACKPKDQFVREGFSTAYPYRDQSDQIAFTPIFWTTAGQMLDCALEMLDKDYRGFDGEQYQSNPLTLVNISHHGLTPNEPEITIERLDKMLSA